MANADQMVTRGIKVDGLDSVENGNQVMDQLIALGVTHVEMDVKNGTFTISYDILETRLDAIEKVLSDAGCPPKTALWSRLRRSLWASSDENMRGHLTATHHCCSKSPR